jgi:hypothetical protein
MNDEQSLGLERAEHIASMPAPLAPYWEGRTFDQALETPIESSNANAAKSALYERLFELLDRNEPALNYQALSQIRHNFERELDLLEEYEAEDRPSARVHLDALLDTILAAIELRLYANSDLLEAFCGQMHHSLNGTHSHQVRLWLNRVGQTSVAAQLSGDGVLAMGILLGTLGETWEEAGTPLLNALDHEDLLVRACAAYQIGLFCARVAPRSEEHDSYRRDYEMDRRLTRGMAPLEDYWATIWKKEVERAGVAGAFWHSAPTWTIDADEWILSLIEQADSEPYFVLFPCNIGFHAHERFSRNPAAVRRMIDAGRIRLAVEAAGDASEVIPGMEPLLMELGENEDGEIARLASWTLAYNYNCLHPNGERLGYVQRDTSSSEYDMYLVFSDQQQRGVPYAVILYPKSPRMHWSQL